VVLLSGELMESVLGGKFPRESSPDKRKRHAPEQHDSSKRRSEIGLDYVEQGPDSLRNGGVLSSLRDDAREQWCVKWGINPSSRFMMMKRTHLSSEESRHQSRSVNEKIAGR